VSTFKDIIDTAQNVLHDTDAEIWSREELLNWARDGLRAAVSRSGSTRTFRTYSLPPRYSYAVSYEWERRYVEGGTYRKFTFAVDTDRFQATALWEIGQVGDIVPVAGLANVTQLWEIAHAGQEIEAHYRLYFPSSKAYLKALWWDHKRLSPIPLRDLDNLRDSWWRVQGEPYQFTEALGRIHTADLYEIVATYQQPYRLVGSEVGHPADFSGERTYDVAGGRTTWDYSYSHTFEAGLLGGLGYRFTGLPDSNGFVAVNQWETTLSGESGRLVGTSHFDTEVNLGLGIIRGVRSPDRQYWPEEQWNISGVIRSIGSSVDNILALYASLPVPEDADERDEVNIIHGQMAKYLTYYVLFQAFNRQGEGYDASLAAFYQQRYGRMPILLRRLANIAHRDASYSRAPRESERQIIPQPHLPSNYPRAPWL
jgi:hypothetical protein